MRASRKGLQRRPDEGVALVLALVFVVLLAAIVTEFTYSTQVDATLIGQESTETEAYLAARSAIALSESVLAADLVVGEAQAQQKGTAVYDSLDEPWASGTPVLKYNDAMVAIQIADEFGKINLNALLYEDSTGKEVENAPLVEALRYIFEQRSPDADPVDAILDWLDSDDTPRPHGFERDYYEKLDPPITCKNGPMDSIEELLLIPGVSQAMYFAESDKKLVGPPPVPMSELLTVHGHPEGRVNINTAPREVLDALFSVSSASGGVTGTSDQVMKRRQDTGPYTSRKELRAEGLLPVPRRGPGGGNPGGGQQAQAPPPGQSGTAAGAGGPDFFVVKSSVFRIHGDSRIGDTSVRVEAYIWRDTSQSQDDTSTGQNDSAAQGTAGGAASGAAQLFRIIDWRVLS